MRDIFMWTICHSVPSTTRFNQYFCFYEGLWLFNPNNIATWVKSTTHILQFSKALSLPLSQLATFIHLYAAGRWKSFNFIGFLSQLSMKKTFFHTQLFPWKQLLTPFSVNKAQKCHKVEAWDDIKMEKCSSLMHRNAELYRAMAIKINKERLLAIRQTFFFLFKFFYAITSSFFGSSI